MALYTSTLILLALLISPLTAISSDSALSNWESVINDLIAQQSELIKNSKTQDKIISDLRKEIRKLQENGGILNTKVEQLESFKSENGQQRAAILRTCEEIRRSDPSSQSGTYFIDPDGDGYGDPPMTVYCNMTTGATAVSHDSENITEADKCANPGCYSRVVNYNGTLRQISALVQQSRSCKQSIRFDCYAVPFEFNGIAQAWWNDVRGIPQYYWAGSNESVHTCQCGIDRDCVDPSVNCNCDSYVFYDLFDYGVLTNKSSLPVTQLNFGRTISPSTYGRHTLGKLECSGREVEDRMPESCDDLWKIGYTLNGFFTVKGDREMQSVYCDFSKTPGEEGQTLIGAVDVKSTPVYFHVQRNSTFSTGSGSNTTIPFQSALVNIGEAMKVTSGIFTAPKAGTYFFAFSGVQYNQERLYVSLDLNGQPVATTVTYGFSFSSYPISLSLVSTLELETDDEVRLVANGRYLLEESNLRYTQFTGVLLQENLSF